MINEREITWFMAVSQEKLLIAFSCLTSAETSITYDKYNFIYQEFHWYFLSGVPAVENGILQLLKLACTAGTSNLYSCSRG